MSLFIHQKATCYGAKLQTSLDTKDGASQFWWQFIMTISTRVVTTYMFETIFEAVSVTLFVNYNPPASTDPQGEFCEQNHVLMSCALNSWVAYSITVIICLMLAIDQP